MKLTKKILLPCLVSGIIFFSCSKDTDEGKVNAVDQTFIMEVSLSNTAEIQAGTLTAGKAEDIGIRSFGEMMVMDHTTAQNDLKTTGSNLEVAVKDSIDAEHVAMMETLNTLSGRAFDSTYIINQITDHQKTIEAFQNEINSGSHIQVTSYANRYLPKIQMHLRVADSIATAMNFK